MDRLNRRGSNSRWLSSVACLCILLTLCTTTVSAVRAKAHYKSLARLKVGLEGVRESSAKAKERLKALKTREGQLTSKLKETIVPKTIPTINQSLQIVRSEIEQLPEGKPKVLRKKLDSLLKEGHGHVLSLLAGSTYTDSAVLKSSDVRHVLHEFDSKDEVLDAIDKVARANAEPSPKTALLAKSEIKKIRFERKALVKKIQKCESDEQTILAEIAVVRAEESKPVDKDFIKPLPGRIVSGFGSRTHPIDHIEKNHEGIDLAGAVGDWVKSSATGKVVYAGEQRGYGNIIIVQHSDTLTTAYAHLSEMDVAVGEEVSQGQKIGKVGMTGNTTGPHLHFEIRENGEQVDPSKYL